MPGTAITKSVVANEPGGRKRDEIFVDVIEKISLTFNSSVSMQVYLLYVYVMQWICYTVFLPLLLLQNFEALWYELYCLKQGFILTSEIDGTIQMKSYLTGNPEIRLALNEDLSIGTSGRSINLCFIDRNLCYILFPLKVEVHKAICMVLLPIYHALF